MDTLPFVPAGRQIANASTAERWARWVAATVESPCDLRTVSAWARFVGVSPATIGEICRLLDVQPNRARDLARMLRALTFARRNRLQLEGVLDVSDRRTFQKLLVRAAIDHSKLAEISLTEFLARQQFISTDNGGLRALRSILQ